MIITKYEQCIQSIYACVYSCINISVLKDLIASIESFVV